MKRASPSFPVQPPVVWVTGASRGIGRELARQFASLGCKTILTARHARQLRALQKEIVSLGGEAYAYRCDLADKKSVSGVVRRIIKTAGPVDILINNAGLTVFKSFSETSLEEFERLVAVNLQGAIYAIKAVLPQMQKRKQGWIINIISTAALKVFVDSSAYSMTKAGLRALGNVLREEIRPYNIKVTNVYPGSTDTAMWGREQRRKYRSRMMSPKSVAEVVLALYHMPPDVVIEEIVLRPIEGDID